MEIPHVVISLDQFKNYQEIENNLNAILEQSNHAYVNFSYGKMSFYSREEFNKLLVEQNEELKKELDILRSEKWYHKLFRI